jgi:FtsZ-interacting cell division protein ZipA
MVLLSSLWIHSQIIVILLFHSLNVSSFCLLDSETESPKAQRLLRKTTKKNIQQQKNEKEQQQQKQKQEQKQEQQEQKQQQQQQQQQQAAITKKERPKRTITQKQRQEDKPQSETKQTEEEKQTLNQTQLETQLKIDLPLIRSSLSFHFISFNPFFILLTWKLTI